MKDNEIWLWLKEWYGWYIFGFVALTILLGWLGMTLAEVNYELMVFISNALIGSFITLLILHLIRKLDTGVQTPDLAVMIYLSFIAYTVVQ